VFINTVVLQLQVGNGFFSDVQHEGELISNISETVSGSSDVSVFTWLIILEDLIVKLH
jgi:hypothetical protein